MAAKYALAIFLVLANVFAVSAQSDRQVNVKSFGAKGDGNTDDTKSIQSALDAIIRTGGTAYFPAGDYKISNNLYLYYASDVPIKLKGDANATIYPNAKRYYIYCNNGDKSKKPFGSLTVEGLKIDGSRLPKPQAAYYDDPSGAYGIFTTNLKNIKIVNNTFANIYGSAIWVVLMKDIDDSSLQTSVTISNNKILNCWGLNPTKDFYDPKDKSKFSYDNYGDGIAVWGYRNAVINDNYIYNDLAKTQHFGRGGIVLENDCANAKITNNTINGYDRNIHIETDKGGHLIANNKLSGSNVGIYFWLAKDWATNSTTIKDNQFSYNDEIAKYKLKTIVGDRKFIMLAGKSTSTYQGTNITGNTFVGTNVTDANQMMALPANLKVNRSANQARRL
ncbi:right-handed parallel beta-helix repeat-containing protein [Chitinophaga filiformis]|uniref:glycosyl hydrolase family 28-related protein n=1 Tax=Chitinophaga filiformis TaxID=104663 RepID=UPI001F4267F7|nr:glycosyl hydrolase family 28-related protein [Chitinophaga filiformis]MCF6402234.1 right-handed parallel beta-helix repeat-containing protein [Chitinophaga filiformis]